MTGRARGELPPDIQLQAHTPPSPAGAKGTTPVAHMPFPVKLYEHPRAGHRHTPQTQDDAWRRLHHLQHPHPHERYVILHCRRGPRWTALSFLRDLTQLRAEHMSSMTRAMTPGHTTQDSVRYTDRIHTSSRTRGDAGRARILRGHSSPGSNHRTKNRGRSARGKGERTKAQHGERRRRTSTCTEGVTVLHAVDARE